VLRIPGSRIRLFSIPDPNYSILDPGSRSRGSRSRIPVPDPDPYFLPIPDPGSRGQKGTGYRIRIRNTGRNIRIRITCGIVFLFCSLASWCIAIYLVYSLYSCGFGSAWIRIDCGRLDADPGQGGQKRPTKIKSEEISSFEVLDVLF
jgi:hypothetical protein